MGAVIGEETVEEFCINTTTFRERWWKSRTSVSTDFIGPVVLVYEAYKRNWTLGVIVHIDNIWALEISPVSLELK